MSHSGKRKHEPRFNPPQHGQTSGTQIVQVTEEHHRGPLPAPETLAKYEQIVPGAAQLIIQQFQKQVDHRHHVENKAVDAQIKDMQNDRAEARLGQIFALLIAFAGMTTTAILGVWGDSAWPPSIVGGGTLLGMVTAFIYGRKKQVIIPEAKKPN